MPFAIKDSFYALKGYLRAAVLRVIVALMTQGSERYSLVHPMKGLKQALHKLND
jgi:hypothetical protein